MNIKKNVRTMANILKHLGRKEWAMIFVALFFIVVQVWLDLTMPEYMGAITKVVTSGTGTMDEIYYNGKFMVLCALGSLAAMIIVGYIASVVGASYAQKVRSLQFDRVGSFSMAEINKFSTASLITRSTNDVMQVQLLLVLGLQIIIKAPILAVWAMFKIYGTAYQWTLSIGIAIVALLFLFAILILLVLPKFRKMQKLIDNVNRVTRENLSGLPVVRAYNAESYQEGKFEDANKELTDTQLYTSRAMAVMWPGINLIMTGSVLAIYWIAAILINNATGNIAEQADVFASMVVFTSYSMQILFAFMMISMLFIMLPRAQVAAKRINELLDTEPSIRDGNINEPDRSKSGEVEFRNVSFRYPGAANNVLENISFTAKRGETVAFIGSTGSGKSTIVNLIPRLYDVSEGSVLVSGNDVRDYKLEALHDMIGYVSQKAVLFSGTVASNVAFGSGADRTDEGVKEAVRIAQGSDFVEKMEGSYDAGIARGGSNVSGGQKQRLSIARAICKRPDIYIFDDSFSALDYRTDRDLRTALKKEMRGATSLIVAQRIGTIMDADRIIVLNEGRIVGTGDHNELLRTCDVYREIAMSQLSEEELNI